MSFTNITPNHIFICSTWCSKIKDQTKSLEKTAQCLKLKEFKQYSATFESTDMDMELIEGLGLTNESKGIQFCLKFSSNIKMENQEILVFDEIDMLGSLGGALGLFIGFSFLSCATKLLETVLEKAATYFKN